VIASEEWLTAHNLISWCIVLCLVHVVLFVFYGTLQNGPNLSNGASGGHSNSDNNPLLGHAHVTAAPNHLHIITLFVLIIGTQALLITRHE